MLKAMGVVSGIGSMLGAARLSGFEIVGNIEHRRYYHKKAEDGKNTFTENFPGSFFHKEWSEMTEEQKELVVGKIDLILGHGECG
jgi:hypothetical protein